MVLRKDWIYICWKDIYIDITNPKRTMNKIKKAFKPLKCYFKFEKGLYAPVLWVSKPHCIQIIFHDVGWKDKYDTPRFEYPPYIWIHLFKWNFVWYWGLPLHQDHREDQYWEQALWYLYYYNNTSYGCNNPDIEKAKESWPWQDYNTKKTTWTDEFLLKYQNL